MKILVMIKKIHLGLAACTISLLALTFSGFVHPVGDSLAVFQLPIGFACLLMLMPLRTGRIFRIGSLLLLLTAAVQIGHRANNKHVNDPQIKVYQKNLSFRIPDIKPLKQDILTQGDIDFITLQEVTDRNAGLMASLLSNFPSQHTCPFAGVGGTAVLSRWPVIEGTKICFDRDGATAMQVITEQGPLWIISVHLNWPYPYRQSNQVDSLSPQLRALHGPKIMAGDFNMVPWSNTMHRMAKDADVSRIGAVHPTFDLPIIPMAVAIDHIFAPKNTSQGMTTIRPMLGSDHYGLVAEIRFDD